MFLRLLATLMGVILLKVYTDTVHAVGLPKKKDK